MHRIAKQLITTHMDKQKLELYESPTTEVVEVKFEGIICGSADPQYTNPFGGGQQNW